MGLNQERILKLYDDSSSIIEVLDSYGLEYKLKSGEYYATCANKEAHRNQDKHPSMRCNDKLGPGGLFVCDACGVRGNKFQLIALLEGTTTKEIWRMVREKFKPYEADPSIYDRIYEYPAPNGVLSRRKVRLKVKSGERKSFGWESLIHGKWMVTTGAGAPGWLYRANKIAGAKDVCIAEGEKDADTLLRFKDSVGVSCCAPSSTWPEAYGKFFRTKRVTIFYDNDAVGKKLLTAQTESLDKHGVAYRICSLPEDSGVKDITDLYDKVGEKKLAKMLGEWSQAPFTSGGVPVGGHGIIEGLLGYRKELLSTGMLDLGKWSDGMGRLVRPVKRGAFIVVAGATASGKTTLMQEMAVMDAAMNVAFVEFELTWQEMAARLWCTKYGDTIDEFEEILKNSSEEQILAAGMPGLENIRIFNGVDVGGRGPEAIAKAVDHYELSSGKHPDMVVVDYIQLMKGRGSKYEAVSDAAQSLRTIAGDKQVIVVAGSQLNRAASKDGDAGLHSMRDSGAIEESSSHLFILRKERKDDLTPEEQADGIEPRENRVILEVLKNPGGYGRTRFESDFSRFRLRSLEHKQDPF